MRTHVIETENMRRFTAVVEALLKAHEGMPRLGLITGEVGLGKTWAVDDFYVNSGAAYVRAVRTWTPASMLRCLLNSLGIEPAWSAADNLYLAVKILQAHADESPARGLLIIDEANYLLQRGNPARPPEILDTLRDLADLAQTPVLLVGEPELLTALKRNALTSRGYRRFWDRVLISAEFKPMSWREVTTACRELCGLDMTPEAAVMTRDATQGNLRRLILFLARLERVANANQSPKVTPEIIQALQGRNARRNKKAVANPAAGLKPALKAV